MAGWQTRKSHGHHPPPHPPAPKPGTSTIKDSRTAKPCRCYLPQISYKPLPPSRTQNPLALPWASSCCNVLPSHHIHRAQSMLSSPTACVRKIQAPIPGPRPRQFDPSRLCCAGPSSPVSLSLLPNSPKSLIGETPLSEIVFPSFWISPSLSYKLESLSVHIQQIFMVCLSQAEEVLGHSGAQCFHLHGNCI